MWNEPTAKQLAQMLGLYETEKVSPLDKVIRMHFFIGGSDWYAAEYSPEDRVFFGYAVLNDDLPNSEWGYFSYDEMRTVNLKGIQIDRDLHWTPRKANDVVKIAEAYQVKGLS